MLPMLGKIPAMVAGGKRIHANGCTSPHANALLNKALCKVDESQESENGGPDTLRLDITGAAHLFGGEAAFLRITAGGSIVHDSLICVTTASATRRK